jgi:hypothetical protein
MMAINMFGFQTVHGMITTGNNWRLVSTSKSSNIDHHLRPESVVEMIGKLTNQVVSASKSDQTKVCSPEVCPKVDGQTSQPEEENSRIERVVYASQIVPSLLKNHQDLDEGMLLALQKSGRENLQIIITFIVESCWNLMPGTQ